MVEGTGLVVVLGTEVRGVVGVGWVRRVGGAGEEGGWGGEEGEEGMATRETPVTCLV